MKIDVLLAVCSCSDRIVEQGLPVRSVVLYRMQQKTMIHIKARLSQKAR